MHPELNKYIADKRTHGLSDEAIKDNLVAGGWNETTVSAALRGDASEVPAPPPPPAGPVVSPIAAGGQPAPVAVVQNFTTTGLEYIIMFISLWVTATSIGFLAHEMVNNALANDTSNTYSFAGFDQMSVAALIVSLPIFTILFLRLKKRENNDASIKNDPSRKKAVQLTLIVTFLTGLLNVIGYIYGLLTPATSGTSDYIGIGASTQGGIINLAHTLITLLIAGGIFAYYWHDEHKKD